MKTLLAMLFLALPCLAEAATQTIYMSSDTVRRRGDTMYGKLTVSTSGATIYSIETSSGIKMNAGCMGFSDGSKQCTASTGGGSGDAVLAATQTFSGQNTFTSDIMLKKGAVTGYWAQSADANGTVSWVASSALPIDPVLIGIDVHQNSATNNEQFWNATSLTHYNYIGMNVKQLNEGGTANAWETDEALMELIIPIAATIKNLACIHQLGPGNGVAGRGVTWTVRKNGADTTLTCLLGNDTTGRTCTDTSHTVSFSAGDRISLKAVGVALSRNSPNGSCYFQMAF